MATKNYSLPQWSDGEEFKVIAQLNPAFTTIDTEIKNNSNVAAEAKSGAAAASTAASKAQGAADNALSIANSAKTTAEASVKYGKVKLVEDENGHGVIVTLGVVNG